MNSSVYILKSDNCQRYYMGSTNNIEKRLSEHNNNKVAATRGKGPWKVVFRQMYKNLSLARKAEYWLKKKKSRKILEKIIQDGQIKTIIN